MASHGDGSNLDPEPPAEADTPDDGGYNDLSDGSYDNDPGAEQGNLPDPDDPDYQ